MKITKTNEVRSVDIKDVSVGSVFEYKSRPYLRVFLSSGHSLAYNSEACHGHAVLDLMNNSITHFVLGVKAECRVCIYAELRHD